MLETQDKDIIDNADIYEDDEDTQKDKYLSFHIGKETYCVDISYVIEIVGIHKITQVPDMPDFVKGVINLRGQIIPVMDVRTRFRMDPREYDDRTCVIIVQVDDTVIGLVVDTVSEVADIPERNISPLPGGGMDKEKSRRYIKAMGKTDDGVKIVLDAKRLVFEDMNASSSNASSA